jgi:lipopolysaccharide export system protein LptC
VESVQLDRDSVIMLKPRLVTKGKTQGNYELTAESATRRINNPNRFLLVNVDARMKKKSGGWSKLRADKGIYDKKTDMLDLKSNVEMRSDNGHIARMDKARLNVKKGTLVTKSPVVVNMPNGVIRANGMEIRENGKVFRFEKRAHMKLNLNKKGRK